MKLSSETPAKKVAQVWVGVGVEKGKQGLGISVHSVFQRLYMVQQIFTFQTLSFPSLCELSFSLFKPYTPFSNTLFRL